MKTVSIMRGIPGSGKSTKAREIDPTGENTCSTDSYFVKNGVYTFDATKLTFYHNLNFQKFLVMLAEGRERIVVDNTNTTAWEYKEYVLAARRYGYSVEFYTFNPKLGDNVVNFEYVSMCAARNSHGVPLAACLKMAERFEIDDQHFTDAA